MKILIGDIGNTLTKLCLINEKLLIINEFTIETRKIINHNNLVIWVIMFTYILLYIYYVYDLWIDSHIIIFL